MPVKRCTSLPNIWELAHKLLNGISKYMKSEQWNGKEWVPDSALEEPMFPRVMFVGAPSCGKTYLSNVIIPKLLGSHVEQVVCCDRMDKCELIGTKELVAASSGQGVVTDISLGPAARALKNGAPLLLDEADMTNRDVRGVLHGLMDDAPFCTDAAGNRINAKPGYTVLLTSNTTPDCFEPAIRDRIEYCLRFTEPNPEAMEGWPKELREVNLAAYRATAKNYAWAAAISTRRINAYRSALRILEGDEASAAYLTMGDAWEEFLSALSNHRGV